MESHYEPEREGKDPDEPGAPVAPGREHEEDDPTGGDRDEPVEPEEGGEMGG